MIDTPEILQTAAQSTAIIHVMVPRDQMRTVMGPGIDELMSTLRSQSIVPAGPGLRTTQNGRRDLRLRDRRARD